MKTKILEALKTKFDGVQDAILNRVIVKLKLDKTVKEEGDVEAAVEKVTFQQVVDSYGDSRATEASTTAVKTFREKHGIGEDGKLIKKADPIKKDPDPDPDPDPNEPAWFKAYREKTEKEQSELKGRLDGINKAKTETERMGKLTKKLEEKGLDKTFIPLFTRNLTIESEDKLDELTETINTDYEKFVQDKADEGVVISIPKDSTSKPSASDATAKKIAEDKNDGVSEGVKGKEL